MSEPRAGAPTLIADIMSAELRRLDAMAPAERAAEEKRLRDERVTTQAPERPAPRWPEIPERFAAATVDGFVGETESERLAQRAVAKWIGKACGKRGVMLALIGSTGVGKSHLLWAAAAELRKSEQPFYARPWYLLADELRWGGPMPWSGAIEDARVCREAMWYSRPVVLLDEIDHTSGTDFDRVELKKFAHHAWDQRYAVLITSPVHPLAEVIGPQAASRFHQIVIEGRDRRQGA